MLQFIATAPIQAFRYFKESLRCNFCHIEFLNNTRIDKWTDSVKSTVVLFKTYGFPFRRLKSLLGQYGVPISEGALWEQVKDLYDGVASSIFEELQKVAANCKTFYADDTGARVLEVIEANKKLPEKERRACHTTGIYTETAEKHPIVLFMTSNKHCGENMAELLKLRTSDADVFINIMGDASSCNISKSDNPLFSIIRFKCLAHARRKVFELKDFYTSQCQFFLDEISSIYTNDRYCKDSKYTPEQRLVYHQNNSKKHIDNIYNKIDHLFANKLIEPNSELGKVMKYWLNHKDGLTKFLHVAGVALDNNQTEQLLRKIIAQRKNSFFFKTLASAKILSDLTSIVSTCEQNGVCAFDYLNWLQANAREVRATPANFLPWKYREHLNQTELIAA